MADKRMKIEPGKVYENGRGVQLCQTGPFVLVRYPHRKSTDLYIVLAPGVGVRVNCRKCKRKVAAIDGRARYHRTRGARCPGTGKPGFHPIRCCNCGQDIAEGQLLIHIDGHDTRRRKKAA